ncbi:unnamed protein product [Prorocentrum cordatum]|uniref:Uncharacterized protein n=1 Tax=Prorocentrum cordatum TaxID=2364126 RepID=A0ABN9TIQ9_9DINO|nr:unnamed protein product [Polarella glacialis]
MLSDRSRRVINCIKICAELRTFMFMQCFFLEGPEVLIPLSPPWLSEIYTFTEHTFNTLCAQDGDPALRSVIRLFSAEPRSAQFALAAVAAEGSSRGTAKPACWACSRPEMRDDALRRRSIETEMLMKRLLRHVVARRGRAWHIPPVFFQLGRLMQGSGDLHGAESAYNAIVTEGLPASLEISREQYRLEQNQTLTLLHLATRGGAAAADPALQLGWLHVRPGSGALFGASHACVAEEWFRRAALHGHPGGALYLGLSLHFGRCAGRMTGAGLRAGARWYRKAVRSAAEGPGGVEARLAARALAVTPW